MYYYNDEMNTANERELTVKITLKEYRNLCRESASHDGEMGKLKKRNYDLEEEIRMLRQRIETLTESIGGLTNV